MTRNTIRTLAASAALAGSLHAAGQSLVTCSRGDLERSVEVVYENAGEPVPCEVRYAKTSGETSSLWRAEHEEGYCERQAVGLIQKLSDAGWACNAATDDGSTAVPAARIEAAVDAAAPEVETADSDAVPEAEPAPDAEPESESE